MNELIERLATEANVEFDHGVPLGFADKFAELMIKECANYINERTLDWDAELRWIFNDGSGDMAVDVDDLLSRHFGVKE